MRSLALLVLVVFLVATASGCGSKHATLPPQAEAVIEVRAPSLTDTRAGTDVLVRRLTHLGVPRHDVTTTRTDGNVAVRFPRAAFSTTTLRLLATRPSIQIFDLENALAGPSVTKHGQIKPAASMYALLASQQPSVEFKGADQWELFDTRTKKLVAGPAANADELFRTQVAEHRHLKPGTPPYVVFGTPKGNVVLSCGSEAPVCPGRFGPSTSSWYLVSDHPAIRQSEVRAASADVDPTGGPVVLLHLTPQGRSDFRQLTRTLYERGRLLQRPQHLGIVVGGRLLSSPQIDYTDTSLASGIAAGPVAVTGLATLQEAKTLAIVVQSGPRPFRFVRVR